MAPLAVAFEKGYFEDEGLSVQLEAQANWKVLLDRVINGELDGAHMLATLPFGTAIGYGTKADIISAFTMTLNGDAITVSNDVWKQMKPQIPMKDGKPVHPIKADALKPVLEKYKSAGKPFNMAMTFPVGTHNMKLRYWLAAGGIKPGFYAPPEDTSGQIDAEAMLSVTPPPQMPATMDSGTIVGYCVGEPWNQQAVFKGIGVPVISDVELMKNMPEKIFGVTQAWADKNPNTHKAVIKALIRASLWLDAENNKNRNEGVEMLSQKQYVGADYEVIANSMNGTFEYEKGDKRALPDFNVFSRYNASYPCHNNVNPQIILFFMVIFRIKSFLLKSCLSSRLGFNTAYRVEFSHFRDRAWRINLTCHIRCPRMWHRFSFIKYSISRVVRQSALLTITAMPSGA